MGSYLKITQLGEKKFKQAADAVLSGGASLSGRNGSAVKASVLLARQRLLENERVSQRRYREAVAVQGGTSATA